MYWASDFMLTQDFNQISCVLYLLEIDSAGSEFVGNLEIIAQLMHMPQQKTRMMRRKIIFI